MKQKLKNSRVTRKLYSALKKRKDDKDNSVKPKSNERSMAAGNNNNKYLNPIKNPDCSEFEVDNWIVSDFIIDRLVPFVGTHPFPLTELTLMAASVVRFRPKAIFEWGTHIGKSARVFYETVTAFDIPCQVHSFDLPDDVDHVEHPHDDRGLLVRGLNVKLYQEDGVSGALRISKQEKIPDSRMLFFVDGDHSYESVKRELAAIVKNHPGAKILLHDTFYQSAGSKYNIGPWQAIDEFVTSHPAYRRLSTNTGLPGMTLVYKDK